MTNERPGQHRGPGASLQREKDDRHLQGRGQCVADIALRGTRVVARVARTRAVAEGAAAAVIIDYQPLDAAVDVLMLLPAPRMPC